MLIWPEEHPRSTDFPLLAAPGQVEFRTHAWWRLGAVTFLGAGDVANEFGDFRLKNLQYSYGIGLRFVFNQKEGINLRADLGFGENTDGLYISVEEAF